MEELAELFEHTATSFTYLLQEIAQLIIGFNIGFDVEEESSRSLEGGYTSHRQSTESDVPAVVAYCQVASSDEEGVMVSFLTVPYL